MKITFDPSFDGGAWPLTAREGEAVFGEVTVGTNGLLRILESQLGLAAPAMDRGLRIAAILDQVAATDGFWAESARTDLLSTAQRLLQITDHLGMAGWEGQGPTSKLASLAKVAEAAPRGVAARIDEVQRRMATWPLDIDRLEIWDPVEHLPRKWLDLLEELSKRVPTQRKNISAVAGSGDLEQVRKSLASPGEARAKPANDGSLRLLRSLGPVAAAEETAAWLASLKDLSETVVIGPDPILDAALARHGLPTSGAGDASTESALLQILPVAIAFAWEPIHPELISSFLSLPVNPLPFPLRRRLAEALREWPSAASTTFQEAIAEGLASMEDKAYREKKAKIVETLFSPKVPVGKDCPRSEIEVRIHCIREWAQKRQHTEIIPSAQSDENWKGLQRQLAALETILNSSSLTAYSRSQVRRIFDLLKPTHPSGPWPSKAGLTFVSDPGAITAPAANVLWWNCTEEAWREPPDFPLPPEDEAAVAALDIQPRDRPSDARIMAERAARPVLLTKERLVLIAPTRNQAGEEIGPHPVFALATSAFPKGTHDHLESTRVSDNLPRPKRKPRPTPRPRENWATGNLELPGKPIAATTVGQLAGCGFAFALQKIAGVDRRFALDYPTKTRLAGKLAHEILEEVLRSPPDRGDEIVQHTQKLLSEALQLRAPELQLAGGDADRARLQDALERSAVALTEAIEQAEFRIDEIETAHERKVADFSVKGTPDVVFASHGGILDLKWGGAASKAEELRKGHAYQLAVYAYLAAGRKKELPPVSYFIIENQTFLPGPKLLLSASAKAAPFSSAEMWDRTRTAITEELAAIQAGDLKTPKIASPGSTIKPMRASFGDEPVLSVNPPCSFCRLDALCGKRFGTTGNSSPT